MNWKNWPYWLRGGIITAVIVGILTVLDLRCEDSAMQVFISSGGAEDFSNLKCVLLDWPGWPMQMMMDNWNLPFFSTAQYLSLVVLSWFVVGSLLGNLLYRFKTKRVHS